ncbi:unnamed protein product, partial [Eretmochelys imbricata]
MMSCGLLTSSKEPVPLHHSSVSVLIRGFVADVGCQLLCRNEELGPVEAVFKFPVDAEALQEKRQAQELYGEGATRYVLLTMLHPCYTPHSETHRSPCASATCPMDGENMIQEVPWVLQGELPYTLSRSAMLQSPHGIDHVLSNCPLTPLSYTAGNLTTAQGVAGPGPPWDRELELLVYYTEPPKPSVVLEAGLPGAEPGSLMGDPAVMMTLLPRVPEVVPAQSQPGSSSSCWAAPAARPAPWTQRPVPPAHQQHQGTETLVLLLKSLPLGCYFNIYGFGSEFESFYPQSVENTQQTKAESLQRLQLLQANLGGTEILEPLRAVYRSPCRDGPQLLAPPGDSPTPQAESPAPPNPELQASDHSDSPQLLRFKP